MSKILPRAARFKRLATLFAASVSDVMSKSRETIVFSSGRMASRDLPLVRHARTHSLTHRRDPCRFKYHSQTTEGSSLVIDGSPVTDVPAVLNEWAKHFEKLGESQLPSSQVDSYQEEASTYLITSLLLLKRSKRPSTI